LVLLLSNSIDDIGFHFVKTRFQLTEAFLEDTCHTHKHISNLLRQSCTERFFELRFHSFDDSFRIPLARLVERYEGVLEFQDLSDDYLHLISGIVALTLDYVVFAEYFGDSFMHLDDNFGYLSLYYGHFE